MSDIRSYRDLHVWQKAMDLAVVAHQTIERLPAFEKYGMTSTIRRLACSIPSLIAEGHGTSSYVSCLSRAHATLMQLETQFLLGQRFGYLDAEAIEAILRQTAEVGRMLHGLMKSIRGYEPDS